MRPTPENLLDLREYPVLLVDDEPENLRMFERGLGRKFSVLTASSGEEALRAVREHPVAVVLSAAMLCHHIGHHKSHRRIRRAVALVTRERPEVLTPDLGGAGTTEGFGEAIVEALPKVSVED